MRPDRVVFHPPPLDQYLGLLQGIEDLSVEQLIPELPVEALVVTVLPGTARFNVERLNTNLAQPLPNYPGRELVTIVRADALGNAMLYKKLCQTVQNIIRLQASLHHKGQALPAVFVDDGQDPQGTPVMGPVGHKVIRPDMIPMSRSKADAGTVIEPQAAPLPLSPGNL